MRTGHYTFRCDPTVIRKLRSRLKRDGQSAAAFMEDAIIAAVDERPTNGTETKMTEDRGQEVKLVIADRDEAMSEKVLLSMTPAMSAEIEDFWHAGRFKNKSDAMRQLLRIALEASKKMKRITS